MIANFATHPAPTAALRLWQRAPFARPLALLAFVTSCGGMSVYHDESDAGADVAATGGTTSAPTSTSTSAPSPPPDAVDACGSVCASCPATSPANCPALCTTIVNDATAAGCAAPLTSLLRCQDATNAGCAIDACPTQNNALTACIIEYCDTHANAAVCVYPL